MFVKSYLILGGPFMMFVKSCLILGGPPEEDGGGNATWVEGKSIFITINFHLIFIYLSHCIIMYSSIYLVLYPNVSNKSISSTKEAKRAQN